MHTYYIEIYMYIYLGISKYKDIYFLALEWNIALKLISGIKYLQTCDKLSTGVYDRLFQVFIIDYFKCLL